MKKLLLLTKIFFVLLLVGISSTGWSQILYEGFNYPTPAFIGGNGDAGAASNNWTTHSVTAGQTTTIDIQSGSLTYPGLASSVGNKAYTFGNANATSRDINRAFTSTATALYFSVLVNVIDNSQILAAGDYFMSFGATSGSSVPGLGARLGAKLATSGTNFRFMILNTSGGTPVFIDNGADLNFGTTYLVVVKYNIGAPLTVATMWVNPVALGGTEPAGGITNNSGTNAITTLASICIRNNATTPKVNIDEIRVGETWASVTPAGAAPLPKLVITEIMYNSPESTDEEWFEIYNSGTTTIDISGFIMSDSDTAHLRNPYVFPAGSSIAPGKYFTAQMSTAGAFPFTPDAVLTTTFVPPFNLGNTSDQVKIYTKEKQLIDSVQYFDTAPWPTAADGTGPSLTLCDPSKDNSLAANWSASTETLPGKTIKATPGSGCVITGIPNKLASDLVVYPNPTSDRIYTSNPANELFEITVISAIGKTVKSVQSRQTLIDVDMSALPKGMYIVRLTSKANNYTRVSKVVLR